MTEPAPELQIQLNAAKHDAEQAARLATENELWARRNETLLALAVKRERDASLMAQNAEYRAAQSARVAAENERWATAARKQALEYEAWARQSDTLLAAANKRIEDLERYLADHRDWALRCEAELARLRAGGSDPKT